MHPITLRLLVQRDLQQVTMPLTLATIRPVAVERVMVVFILEH